MKPIFQHPVAEAQERKGLPQFPHDTESEEHDMWSRDLAGDPLSMEN